MSRTLTHPPLREKRPGFFVRQFSIEPTRAQDNFDVAFGVVLPVVCFMFDPIVFKGGFFGAGEPFLSKYQLFAYLLSAIEITALLVWLTMRRHLQSFSGPMAGVLILGAIFSFLIGVLIFPLSMLGLMILIGAAGFTPLFTGVVYLRNGVRALRVHEINGAYESRFLVAVAAMIISLALPVFISVQISQTISSSIDTVLNGDAQQAAGAVARLKWLPFVPKESLTQMVLAYSRESDPAKKELLKSAYQSLTGEDIERRLMIMND